jgi:hypothetical protein
MPCVGMESSKVLYWPNYSNCSNNKNELYHRSNGIAGVPRIAVEKVVF